MSQENNEQRGPGRSLLGPRIFAALLLALGVFVLYQTFQIREPGGYQAVGPRFFPFIVSFGLLAFGAIFALRTTLLPDHDLAELSLAQDKTTHWPTVIALLVLLLAYSFILGPLGYIVSTTLFFPVGAYILGSRKVVRDIVIGLAVSLVIYFGFTGPLGVRLPAGILKALLG